MIIKVPVTNGNLGALSMPRKKVIVILVSLPVLIVLLLYSKTVGHPKNDIQQFYIYSAYRVSDGVIRLTTVKSHHNLNNLQYKFGNKTGVVSFTCQISDCPLPYSPPCLLTGYVGVVSGLEPDDTGDFVYLKKPEHTQFTVKIKIQDVRPPLKIIVFDNTDIDNTIRPILPNFDKIYKHKLGVCIQPIYLMSDYSLFIQFFEYWLNEGATKFYLYWESVTPEVMEMIKFYQQFNQIQIELIPWSQLPSSPREQNPNYFWFRLEVTSAIFDCVSRARFKVKYLAQTDLDEIFFVKNNLSLLEYLDKMNGKNRSLAGVQFLSQRVQFFHESRTEINNPSEFYFQKYRKFAVDRVPFRKPLYTKIIYRPERVFRVNIHSSVVAEKVFPGFSEKRFDFADAEPGDAVVLHIRKMKDYFNTRGCIVSTMLSHLSKVWEDNFKQKLNVTGFDTSKKWKNYGTILGSKLEKCRQNQHFERKKYCHNLLYCEHQIAEMKQINWIRSRNSWYSV